jgi:hypothetical protein
MVLVEKQEFFKTLDNYQKSYIKNMDFLKNYAQTIL